MFPMLLLWTEFLFLLPFWIKPTYSWTAVQQSLDDPRIATAVLRKKTKRSGMIAMTMMMNKQQIQRLLDQTTGARTSPYFSRIFSSSTSTTSPPQPVAMLPSVHDGFPHPSTNPDEVNDDMAKTDDMDDTSDYDHRILSYLPDHGASLPKNLKRLVARATRQFVLLAHSVSSGPNLFSYHHRNHPDRDTSDESSSYSLVMDLVELIESEYKTRKVPVQWKLSTTTTTNSTTTTTAGMKCETDAEQLAAEILSLAALYALPYEITRVFLLEWIHMLSSSNTNNDDKVPYSILQQLVQTGMSWEDIRFPKGLAIVRGVPKDRRSKWWSRRRLSRTRWPNAKQAQELVLIASQQPLPPMVNRTELLLQSIRYENEAAPGAIPQSVSNNNKTATTTVTPVTMLVPASAAATTTATTTKSRLMIPLYFPTRSRRRRFVEHVRGQLTTLGQTVKAQGRAGFLAYCLFNFVFYTFGMLWQWNTRASTRSLLLLLSDNTCPNRSTAVIRLIGRKYVKIFGILFAASQLLKIPKLIICAGLAPGLRSILSKLQRHWNWSEQFSSVVLVMAMIGIFAMTMLVPMVYEYQLLRRMMLVNTAVVVLPMVQPV